MSGIISKTEREMCKFIFDDRELFFTFFTIENLFYIYACEFIFDVREFILEIWDLIPDVRQFNSRPSENYSQRLEIYSRLSGIIYHNRKFFLDAE